jgi:hypothetical protein
MEQAAIESGRTGLQLDAALNAVPFYRSRGYKIVGASNPLCANGVALPCTRMAKTLSNPVHVFKPKPSFALTPAWIPA